MRIRLMVIGVTLSSERRSPNEPDRVLHARWRHAGTGGPGYRAQIMRVNALMMGAHPGYDPFLSRPVKTLRLKRVKPGGHDACDLDKDHRRRACFGRGRGRAKSRPAAESPGERCAARRYVDGYAGVQHARSDDGSSRRI